MALARGRLQSLELLDAAGALPGRADLYSKSRGHGKQLIMLSERRRLVAAGRIGLHTTSRGQTCLT